MSILLVAAGNAQEPFHVSVSVNLVVLNATVRDSKGQFAPDLREQDFEVFEDGVRQTIRLFRHEDVPVTVGLVVDHSGSMRSKLTDVIAAARTFAMASSAADEMFVMNFNEKARLGLPDAIRFTNRAEDLERAISNAPTAGQTALYDAVFQARGHLQTGSRDKKVLIVISDGADNASRQNLAGILRMAEQSNALVYTIGIFDETDPDKNPRVLKRLAHATGGEAFFPGEMSEVVAICERIAREIRNQYTLGYVSSNPERDGYRTVRVGARIGNKKLIVRTRSGYVGGRNEGVR
ncbi:MAG TPA: VWA domain-containing protein [Bryobacteraceae bacterium]|nr:VWA domain-containing protein [Bryobacteraceae bacterium]